MSKSPLWLLLCLAVLWAGGDAVGADAPNPAATVDAAVGDPPSPARSLLNLAPEAVNRLSPLHRDLRVVLLAEREQLDKLHTAFTAEKDARRRLEIQRQIRDLKVETEMDLVRTQIEHARNAGRSADVERLEASLACMAKPLASDPAAARARAQATTPPASQH